MDGCPFTRLVNMAAPMDIRLLFFEFQDKEEGVFQKTKNTGK